MSYNNQNTELDPNQKIYKYLDLERFIDFITHDYLYWGNIITLQKSDQFEGYRDHLYYYDPLSKAIDRDPGNGPDLMKTKIGRRYKLEKSLSKITENQIFISCWTRDNDSNALWKIYGKHKDNKGVILQTSVDRFKNEINLSEKYLIDDSDFPFYRYKKNFLENLVGRKKIDFRIFDLVREIPKENLGIRKVKYLPGTSDHHWISLVTEKAPIDRYIDFTINDLVRQNKNNIFDFLSIKMTSFEYEKEVRFMILIEKQDKDEKEWKIDDKPENWEGIIIPINPTRFLDKIIVYDPNFQYTIEMLLNNLGLDIKVESQLKYRTEI